ncbi:MAG: SPOR domain-containing protein [Bacteroidales bacterium]|nr:SPOR domain-containing protein [Bacteroidales bacterium]
MRKALIIAALAVSVCLLGGCDFFRVLAGRPTSHEIEAKRKTILALDRDTLTQQPAADSVLAVQESLPATEPETTPQTEQKAPQTAPKAPAAGDPKVSTRSSDTFTQSRPEYRYYVMIGTFGSRENAVRLASKAEAAGYQTALLPFKSGLTAVGVSPSNDLGTVCAALEKLRSEAFCPKDAWILNIE